MSAKVTEREVASDLASELTRYVEQSRLPFEKVTVEAQTGGSYPDIIVWTRYDSRQAFAFWELKRPGLQEDLSKLPQKAKNLKAHYVVVWNFQQGELYEVREGRLEPRKSYPTPVLSSLEEWRTLPKHRAAIEQAQRILDDLARLAQGEALTPFAPDKVYFMEVLRRAIHRLTPTLQMRISKARKDKEKDRQLNIWTVKQGYPVELPDLDRLLAQHWAYSLAVRVLFYFTIQRYYPGLPDLAEAPQSSKSLRDFLREAFSKAQHIDWHAVFEESPLDKIGFPDETEPILRELLEGFQRYDFSLLKEDVIGQIMEGLIPQTERHALGQYFTREDLVDFIIGFVAKKDEACYLDPTCGTGTFLNRLYSRLRWLSGYKAAHTELLERLWGVEIAHFPAELATINLFRQNVQDQTNFPRIVVRDFFQLEPGQLVDFPPLRRTSASSQERIQVPFPQMEGIVGNFPYIRQELIEKQERGYKKQIVQAIAQQWFCPDPELFVLRGQKVRKTELERLCQELPALRNARLHEQIQNDRIELRLSGQADIYAYLFYHAAAFLREEGRMGIVTSNAWLDVAYGEELKRFFLRHFKIIAIVASWAEPWFEDAAVNTAFVILERCSDPAERERNLVRFVKVKKPLSELLPGDLLLEEVRRWQKVDALVRQIEAAGAQFESWDPATGEPTLTLKEVYTEEKEAFRIRLVPQVRLEAELQAKGPTAKWGLYLRAPQVYFDLLQAVGDKLVPLSQVAEVRFGIKTGINDFFYLEPLDEPAETPGAVRVKNARGWVGEIEEACLRPVIKSPKEAKALVVDLDALKYRLFLPPLDPNTPHPEKELQARYPLAYQYVKWGEQQRTPTGQPWPKVPSVRGRKAWWLMLERIPGRILMPMTNNERFAVFQNTGACVDHRLFEFLVSEEYVLLVAGLMNSTLCALVREVVSRVNLGDGATETEGIDWKESVLIPAPHQIDAAAQRAVIRAYDALKNRPVRPIAEEVKQKDRRALDKAVLEALGLDPRQWLPRIYEGLVELVEERLALPAMRKTYKVRERQLSFEQVKAKVRESVLPKGLRSITAYVEAGTEKVRIPLTGRPVQYELLFDELLFRDAEGCEVGKCSPGNEDLGRYVLYAAGLEKSYLIEAPCDPIVVKNVVKEYEHYLQEEVGQKLLEEAFYITRDVKRAEQVAREILGDLGLPKIGIEVAMG